MRRGGGRESAAQAGGRATDPDPYRQFIEAGSLRVSKDRDGDIRGLTIADPFPAELRPQALLAFGARHTSTLRSLDVGGAADFSEQELDECIGWLGHVSRLAVPHGLSKRMAARVRKLTGLRTLDLSSLPVNGPAPATWIEPIAWIEHLVLGPAATDADLVAAARLEGLRRLDIVGNRRVTDSGFATVATSGSLAEVSIWLSSIGPDGLASLAMLEPLRRLTLDGVTVAPEHFEAFAGRQLESLELPTGLRDRSGLELLVRVAPGVTSLSLSGWALADEDLALLPAFHALETLCLAGCDWLSDAGLEHVGRVASLRSIDLTRCPGISARGIASLRHLSLEDLMLPPLGSSDEALATLVDRCQRVRDELVITDSDTRPETVRRAIERWQPARIVLHGRQFDDSLLDTLAANTNLRHLDIARTAISAAVLPRFAGRTLDALELPARLRTDATLPGWLAAVRIGRDFDLTRWRITPAAVASLPLTANEGRPFRLLRLPPAARDDAALGEWLRRQPPRGSRLDLRGWRITDASLPMLAGLEQVTRLDLRGTLISAEGLAAFEGRALRGLRLPRACDTVAGQIRKRMLLGKAERIRLNLSGQALLAEDVRALARSRPREVVLAGLEAISAETLAAWRDQASQITSLERLVLAGPIGDSVVDLVEALPEVRRLDLSATAVTDAGLRRLRDRDFEELKVPRECRGPGGSVRAFVGNIPEPPGTVVNSIGMRLVPIAPGKFRMGAGKEDPHAISQEEHPHWVEITRPFLIGMHAVTQAEFQRVMGANPSLTRGDTHPADHVEWQAAVDFCERLSALPEEQSAGRSYRLPTEAEWEYCCRAGTPTPWNVGAHLPRHRARFASGLRRDPAETVPVGTYPPNAWGLYEMHGNVWEWTSDWYGFEYYENSRRINPLGPVSGTHHTARGGSASVQDHECRSAIRGEANDDVIGANSRGLFGQLGDFGLRVVCEVPVSAGLPTRTHRILDRHLGSEEAGQVGMGLALLRASSATDADIREAISIPVLRWILKHALLDGVRPEILEPLTACLGRRDAIRDEWEVTVACGFADRAFVRRSLDDPDRRLPIIEALAKRPALASLHELLSQQPAAPGIALDSLTTLSVASAKRLAKHKGPVSLKGLESVSGKVRSILAAAKNISWNPPAATPAAGDVAGMGSGVKTDSRTIRIFISSTFRDFAGERDLLVRKVFPELRRRCRERQVELVDVDLRWGITEAEAEQGKVLPICLAEIDRARPFFMGLLGERYGWVPAAGQFDRSLLIEQPWLEEHAGGKSVTELEILHGVLNNPQMAGRAFFYFRDPAWSEQQGTDCTCATAAEQDKLAELKDRIRASGFPVVEDYADPEVLAERVREDLWNLIDAAYPKADVPDPLALERRRHEAYAASRRRLYLGGERYFEALDAELAAESPRPVLVRGRSGGGKSALVANWLAQWSQAHPDIAVIVHHLGCGADAADPVRLAVRIMQEIARLVGEEFKPTSDPDEQLDELATWLATASAWAGRTGRTVLIVLDGLDKLAERRHLRWFPTVLPSGVRLVASCLDGEVLEAASPRLPWRELAVEPFTTAEQTRFIGEYLGRFRKQLTPEQAGLLQAHPLVGNPLFLLTVLEELRVFGVHEELDQRLSTLLSPPPSKPAGEEPTVDDVFEHVLARIEVDHGVEPVQRVMQAIWASRAGLYTDEILAIAEVPPATWASIANALDESLYESSGRINFGHDYLRKAVEDRYAITGNTRLALHRRLGEYFTRREPDARVAEELPWQWEQAGEKPRLEACLTDANLFVALKERDEYELLAYWLRLGEDPGSAYETAWQRWELDDGDTDLPVLSLAQFLNTAGCYTTFAIRMWADVLRLTHEKLGHDHSDTLSAMSGLAVSCWGAGSLYKALEVWEEVLHLRRMKLGLNHPDTLMVMTDLAVSYWRVGRLPEAWEMATDVRRRSREKLGTGHPSTIRMMNTLASSGLDYSPADADGLGGDSCGEGDVARREPAELRMRENVLRLMQERMGKHHPKTLVALSNVADSYHALGRLEEAIKAKQEALHLMRQHLGDRHPDTLKAMSSLARSLSAVGSPIEAMAAREELVSLMRERLGAGHPDTEMEVGELARCYEAAGLTSLSDAAAEELGKHSGNLGLDFLTHLSDAAAQALAGHEGMLLLNGLTSLSDVSAQALGRHKGLLCLNGVTSLSDGAAQSLACHDGNLSLNGLLGLGETAARALATHKEGLQLNGLTSLSDAAAHALAQHRSSRSGILELNGVISLSDAAAESFAAHEGYLSLNGVTSLSDSAARSLAKHKEWLQLNGLTSLGDVAAQELAMHREWLELNALTSLSDAAAQALASHSGRLDLQGLTTLSDTPGHLALAKNLARNEGLHLNSLTALGVGAAEVLGEHKGYLCLNGLETLSDAAAQALANHEGTLELEGLTSLSDSPGHVALAKKLAKNEEYLYLNHLTSLSAAAARALAKHAGSLNLEGLTSLSDDTAEALAQHHDVSLGEAAREAVDRAVERRKCDPDSEDEDKGSEDCKAHAWESDVAPPAVSIALTPEPSGTITNSLGMKFVPIPEGDFLMGAPDDCPFGDAEEEFQHRVRITKSFLFGMHQVTQSQYEQVAGENPSFFKGSDLPVEHLSWKDAQQFCELLSTLPAEHAAGRRYRLPTEAEWEYACRAGTTTIFNTGDTLEPHHARFASTSRSSPNKTVPVGSYPPNVWGLFDMHGNVWEWTSDWFSADYFRESPVDDPQGPPTGTHHTLRGGSASVEAHECRSAIRGEASAVDGPETDTGNRYRLYGDFGIRVVCIVTPPHKVHEQDSTVHETNEEPPARAIGLKPAASGLSSRTVRIFISSTFRDFAGERDLLVRKVFPELRRRCRERQVELVDVDLRWGITEAEAEQGKVLPICLAEIDRARPFFMGLLGERYGWVPAAGQFDRSLLIEQPWLEEHAGGKSVTELEILHGVLNNPEMAGRAFFYFRDPAWSATQGADYATGSEAERQKLADLKDRIRASGMPVREGYAEPASLAGIVLEDLWTALDREFPAGTEPTPLEREALDHSAFAASRYTVFVGRDEQLQLLTTHVTHGRQPMVVTGEPGSGKSALLANWLRLQRSQETSAWIFEHYVGASAQSTTYADLIRRIIVEIAGLLSIQAEVSDATADLFRQFPEWLEKLSAELQAKGTSAVLVLDGLDQMQDDDSAAELRWLPQQFPASVQVIVSAQPGFGLDTLKKRGWPIVSLPLLTEPDRKALVRDSLARYRKSLTTERLNRLASAPAAANPLYLKALVDELRVCASHETLDEQIQNYLEASDPSALFAKVLERIETDHEADAPGLVRDALRLVWAARDGCSEAELLVLLKRPGDDRLPQAVWSPVYVAIEPFLVRRAGLYTLCHAFFRQAVQKRYFADEKDARAAHRTLADFFEHEQPSPRTEREAAWQLYEASENARLNAYLRQPGNFMLLLKNAVDDLGRFISVACANEDKTTFIKNVLTDYLTHQPDSWAKDVLFVCMPLESLCARIGDSGIWVKDFINANQRATKGRLRVLQGPKRLTMSAVAEGSFTSQVNKLVLATENARIDPLCDAVRNAESLLYDCHYGVGLPADSTITLSDIHSEMRRLLDAAERGFVKRAELETEYVTSGDEAYELRSARRKHLVLIGELRALMAETEEDYAHAHALLDEALAVAESFWGTSHTELLPVLRAIVNTAKTSGEPSRGLAAAHRGLSLCLADGGPVHRDIKWWLQNYCARAIDLGEPTLAEGLCSEVLEKQEAMVGANHMEMVYTLHTRAQVRYKSGDAMGEKQDYQRALAILDAVEEPDDDLRQSIIEQYEALLAEEHATDHVSLAGPGAGGARDDGQSLDLILQDWIIVSEAQCAGRLESFQRLADRLAARGYYAAAGRLYARALEGCELFLGGEHPATDHYRRLHAECLAALGSSE